MKREKLQSFRKEQSLTQEQMARKLEITVSHYKAIEYNLRNPSYELLERFKIKFPSVKIEEIFLNEKSTLRIQN